MMRCHSILAWIADPAYEQNVFTHVYTLIQKTTGYKISVGALKVHIARRERFRSS